MDHKKIPTQIKHILFFIAFGAVTLSAAWHFGNVLAFLRTVIGFLSPVIIGFIIAFILNVPMSFFEKLFARIQKKHGKEVRENLNTAIALILTAIITLTILGLVIWGIVPHLVSSVKSAITSVYNNYPHALSFLEKNGIETARIREIVESFNLKELIPNLEKYLDRILKFSFSALSSVFSTFFSCFTCVILSIYMLASKNRLKRQFNRVLNASCKPETAVKVRHVFGVAYRCFRSFISGQCTEALILGVMFFVVLSVMGMPYTFLISMLIAVTAIIPYVGAFIGFFIGAIMILMTDPVKALIFAVTFLVLQQLEEQLIYPRVVGKSVGLPPVWTLSALLVGGKVGGIVGMLAFIPLAAVVYALVKEYVRGKEQSKAVFDSGF